MQNSSQVGVATLKIYLDPRMGQIIGWYAHQRPIAFLRMILLS